LTVIAMPRAAAAFWRVVGVTLVPLASLRLTGARRQGRGRLSAVAASDVGRTGCGRWYAR